MMLNSVVLAKGGIVILAVFCMTESFMTSALRDSSIDVTTGEGDDSFAAKDELATYVAE